MRRVIPAALWVAWVLFLVQGSVGAAPGEPAGPVQLVHDFFPGEFEGNGPLPQFTRLGRTLFFVADDRETGQGVWRTDGTAAGTQQVPVTGVSGSFEDATILGTLGGRILWLAGPSAVSGETALLSAGEEGDGALLASFSSGSRPKILGERLYFLRCADTGCAVWSTDGTAAGTAPVPALVGRNADARALETLADRWLIFWDGPALLAYDLKRNETLHLLETGAVYVDLYPVGEALFVRTAIDDNSGATLRLWASRLDAPRARLLFTSKDIGVAGWRDGRLYFAPYNGRLWSTDGRPEGTFPYSGVRVESFSLLADQLGPIGSKTLIPMPGYYWGGLLAADETKRELSVVLPVCSGKYPCLASRQSAVTVAGGLGFEEVNGLLARSDGTPEGTVLGSGLRYVDPKTFGVVDGRLVLGARRQGVEQLWETDGTAAGTRSLSDGTRDRPFRVQGPPISYNGALFAAAERKPVGQQVWRIESGRTTAMTDLRHLASGIDPRQAFPAGARTVLSGTAIYDWVGAGGDGTVEMLPDVENPCDQILSPDACPNPPLQVGGRLLFGKASEEDLSRSLWSTDGTAAGTAPRPSCSGGSGSPRAPRRAPARSRGLWRPSRRGISSPWATGATSPPARPGMAVSSGRPTGSARPPSGSPTSGRDRAAAIRRSCGPATASSCSPPPGPPWAASSGGSI
jgi:ELWxxDGT repeat protein